MSPAADTTGGKIPTIRLDRSQFRALAAGYGGHDAIAVLNAGQQSRRRLLLHAILEAADRRGLRTATGADQAIELLSTAWRRSAAAARPVLEHPYLGSWAHRCLWLLTSRRDSSDDLTADLGYLHAVAAAAAIRAGVDFEVTVPARDGTVSLPTLGAAHGLRDGPVVVRYDPAHGLALRGPAGWLRIPEPLEAEQPGWAPRREIQLDGLTLAIEDTDGYRDCYPWRPARRLSRDEFTRATHLLTAAWRLVRIDHPKHAQAMTVGLRSVVPVAGPDRASTVSAASRLAYGSLAIALPDDPATVALLLIHEFQHMKLGGLLDLVRLHDDDGAPRHFAPWRLDPRPLDALLQGTYAHLGVTDFWRRQRRRAAPADRRRAEFEFAYWLNQTVSAAQTLAGSTALTADGREFAAILADSLLKMATDPAPDEIERGVRTLADAATIRWRLINLRPTEEGLRRLGDAWRRGDRPARESPDGPVPAAPRPAMPAGLPALVREALIHPGTTPVGTDVPAAEHAYLAGEPATALAGFADRIAAGTDDDETWLGLALALAASGQAGAAAMVEFPETVRALHGRLRGADGPDPVQLAAWLASPGDG
nr:HEXXH motif domain-containing protein [Micromonospora sp. DSM 115978]